MGVREVLAKEEGTELPDAEGGERGSSWQRALTQLGILEPPMSRFSGKVQGVWGGENGERGRHSRGVKVGQERDIETHT